MAIGENMAMIATIVITTTTNADQYALPFGRCVRGAESMTDQEQVLEQLERESLTHNSPIDADIEWWKPHAADHGVFIGPLGHVYSFTPSEYETAMKSMAKADPNVKNTVEIQSVTVLISGDTGSVIALQHGS